MHHCVLTASRFPLSSSALCADRIAVSSYPLELDISRSDADARNPGNKLAPFVSAFAEACRASLNSFRCVLTVRAQDL
jgi:hypothetical protein